MSIYDPANWYYLVGSDQSQVFATARAIYVPLSDPAYVAWLAQNNQPSPIADAATLGGLLATLLIRPSDPAILDGYQNQQAARIITRAQFKIMFNHENRIRAIERALNLNGSPLNLTQGQAIAAVKALM
jgi:hypothetical protein